MEDVLAVYTRPHDPDRPLVCVDETSKQLLAETRVPIPMKPGRPARFDYEYERNGTANLFMMFAPLEGWRHVKVTDRHTAVDYAHVLKDLADVHFPTARTIVLVQDNLNIHSKASAGGADKRNAGEGRDAHFPVMSGTRRTAPRSRSARGRRAARPRLPVLHPLIPPDREPGPEILRLGPSFGVLPAKAAERPGRASRLNRGER